VKQFAQFHGFRQPEELHEEEINAFLSHLAVRKRVSASTQTQALSAILFLYRHVFSREVGQLEGLVRARKPRRLPVVLSREEVRAVLDELSGHYRLMATLMYGAGLRLMECSRLRVKEVDLAANQITVREGKGNQDRITMLPRTAKDGLPEQLAKARQLRSTDLRDGFGRVPLPHALERKYPNASAE